MKAVVEKQVQLADYRAKRLEQLAAARGTTENALIEEGLDLLFREQERQTTSESVLAEDLELLRQFDAERGPLPSSRARININPDRIVSIVGTPIDPATIRRLGN